MTANELLSIVRFDLDDTVEPYSWSDEFLLREIGNAQREASYRQDLRHIYGGPYRFVVTEGLRSYPIPNGVLRIDEVTLDGSLLRHTTRAALDADHRGWRNAAPGKARAFYVQGRSLYLDREPGATEGGLPLRMMAWVEPTLNPLDAPDVELEWADSPERLAHWVCFKALLRDDVDSQNKDLAKSHFDLFNAAFGPEVPAKVRAELLAYPDHLSWAPASPHSERRNPDLW